MSRYICGSKTILICDKSESKMITLPLLCGRTNGENACRNCRTYRCKRIKKQIKAENPATLYWKIVSEEDAKRILDHLKHTQARYKKLPQEDESVAIIANLNNHLIGKKLPVGEEEFDSLINKIVDTPKGKRQSSSRGFGGEFKNVRSRSDKDGYIVEEPPKIVNKYLEQAGGFIMGDENSKGMAVYSITPNQQEFAISLMNKDLIFPERFKRMENSINSDQFKDAAGL